MSRFLTSLHKDLQAYTPGEQPQDRTYIKLNTNESPFPPSPAVREAVAEEAGRLQLYSDPRSKALTQAVAELYDVEPDMVLMTNGSDEILNFAFMAFCGPDRPAAFPDITYGFYSVFGDLHHIPYKEIPLTQEYAVDISQYMGNDRTIFIANPNAPTGLALTLSQIEEILKANPDQVVVIDEAYGDFAEESAIPLVKKYENLLVTRTFSKSYSMAGARLGMGIGSKELIRDLDTIKYSTNPYNVNRMTAAAGLAALRENAYYMANCETIKKTRSRVTGELEKLGFRVLSSQTNFLFAAHNSVPGEAFYQGLKNRGILVRYFDKPRTRAFVRITVGTDSQMDALLDGIREILSERQETL